MTIYLNEKFHHTTVFCVSNKYYYGAFRTTHTQNHTVFFATVFVHGYFFWEGDFDFVSHKYICMHVFLLSQYICVNG